MHRWSKPAVLLVLLLVPAGAGCVGSDAGGSDAGGRAGAGQAGSSPSALTSVRCTPPFRAGAWPGACWRPYGAASPFNQPLRAKPRLAPRSAAAVAKLTAAGGPADLQLGTADTPEDYQHPVYWSRRGDPTFTVRCLRHEWGQCEVEGARIRIPARARAAGGDDAHVAVVDQRRGWEYDLWQVRSKPAAGGVLRVSWGGRTRIGRPGSTGLGSDATAAHFALLAGVIRAPELAAGRIDHALFVRIDCDGGRAVFPAAGRGARCDDPSDAPPEGARFQLAMSAREIDALRAAPWKRAILLAMARYGFFVGDTGASPWDVALESGSSYTSFGFRDPWRDVARLAGVPAASDGVYRLDLADGVPWGRLRMIDPCVSARTCAGGG